MNEPIHHHLVREMEANLRHGDNYEGVGWTKSQANTDLRYEIMAGLIPPDTACTLLDVGCGAAHFYEYLRAKGPAMANVSYSGLDLSPAYLALCRHKHPEITFYQLDLLDPNAPPIPSHDYVVMNGVFNYKSEFSFDHMWSYCQALLKRATALSRRGFAFNVVTEHVDWERADLFHLPIGMVTDFIARHCSRSFIVRHDYGLFEYTVYVYLDGGPATAARVR